MCAGVGLHVVSQAGPGSPPPPTLIFCQELLELCCSEGRNVLHECVWFTLKFSFMGWYSHRFSSLLLLRGVCLFFGAIMVQKVLC